MSSIWSSTKKFRVVLLGGGHTNTQVLKFIQRKDVPKHISLILVSDYATSLYSGMCPGGVGLAYKEPDFSVDLVGTCKELGWEWIKAKIIEIDGNNNTLISSDGNNIKYDLLAIDIGSTNLGLDLEGISSNCISTRPLKLLMSKVETATNKLINKIKTNNLNNINLITVGGGAAGCELSMNIRTRILNHFKLSNINNCNITSNLITASDNILVKEPKELINTVRNALKLRNINVICSTKVIKVSDKQVFLNNGKTLPYDICLWATGAASHKIKSNIARDDRGFFKVNKSLQSLSHSNIFGAGDCINIDDYPSNFPPKAGVYAVREGPILINNILSYLKSNDLNNLDFQSYKPQTDFLRLLNTGNNNGIGCKFGISFEGMWVWKLKDWIDVAWMKKFYLDNVKNKGDKHFNPNIKKNNKQNNEKKEEKEDIKIEYSANDYAKALLLKDNVTNYQNFDIQWEALVKMNKDENLCQKVVKIVKESQNKN